MADNTVIIGLHVDISGEELKTLLGTRVKYHEDAINAYEAQLGPMREAQKLLREEREQIGKSSNSTPIESLEQSIEKHKNQRVYFSFLAAHIVEKNTYRLSEADLVRLGIATQRW